MDARRTKTQRTAFSTSASSHAAVKKNIAMSSNGFGSGARSPTRSSAPAAKRVPSRSPTRVKAMSVEQQLRNGNSKDGPTQGDYLRAAKARRQQGLASRQNFEGEPRL
uniref:Uncharacterized protein n=1 Tax=Palpitomonas bilix TaxID=652834 RepID=A0A7S3FZY3_9EUKA|mmetsp:Transcript_13980/g.35989  ORF Transcript_13980/g.35989 Transcript_13980/m.35989 type:complete len:108 (+) Transcript_13980:238-561(+)